MKILAIDSSGLVASAAVLEFGEMPIMTAEYTVNFKKTHSQTLIPMLDEIKRMIDLDLETIDAIAIAAGPGSFTGLRIGSATVKGLGLALNKPIISVPTVDALAFNLCGTDKLICPIMDARRGQVYTGLYTFSGNDYQVVREQCAVMIDEIVEEINCLGRETIFLGDGVPVFEEHLREIMKVPYLFAPPHMGRQRAGAVGVLAYKYYLKETCEKDKVKNEEAEQARHIQTATEHKPDYLRLSQAERELAEKQHVTGSEKNSNK